MLYIVRATKGLDYRYRLVETANTGLMGRDPTNQLASEIFGSEERRILMNTFDVTVHEKAPTFWHAEFPQDDYGTIRIVRGLFPLSENGNDVNMLFCIAVKQKTLPWYPVELWERTNPNAQI